MNTASIDVLHIVNEIQGDENVFVHPEAVAERLGMSADMVRGHFRLLEQQDLLLTTGCKGAPLMAQITDLGRLVLKDPSVLRDQMM